MTSVATIETGSQKVVGLNPISSTRKSSEAKSNSNYLSIRPNFQAALSGRDNIIAGSFTEIRRYLNGNIRLNQEIRRSGQI